ncbi:MAG: FecR domain-containing protein [Pseudomonadales bacterium]|jgi:hypothetical protein|nr:FecR domain-containing protein [Pseudomonadales bacterium]
MPTKALKRAAITQAAIKRIAQGFLLGGLCQAAVAWASSGAEQQASAAVGQVNLVLGKAVIVHANGASEPAKTGLAVKVGDRVETQNNAHVHIRFVDNELVSVRPRSRLEIQRYDYRADDPAASMVKFNLIEGAARAISGDAAQSARQNFRLNTPVAAIGVRGTDFEVSAGQREARALVNEGAIVVAPFSATCLVEAFGPCTENGLELAGGAQQMALVMADSAPVLVAINGGATENFLASAAVHANDDSGNGDNGARVVAVAPEPKKDSGGGDIVIEAVPTLASVAGTEQAFDRVRRAPLPPLSPEILDPKPFSYTPGAPLSAAELTANQLVWGRYADTASIDLLTLPAGSITASASRQATVSDLSRYGSYVLYRLEETGSNQVQLQTQPGLVLGFDLKQAQVFYTRGDAANAVDVLGGLLNIDFDQGRFDTRLSLSQEQLGALTLSSQGSISSGGYFNDDHSVAGQIVSGAVSLDGKEAGYLFEKTLENGLLQGLTLWGRTP